MSLPNLPAGDKFRREVRTEWGGINLNENAGDGELIEAVNMSSREFPLLANARFSKTQAEAEMNAPYVYDGKLGYEYKELGPYGYGVYLHDPTRPGVLDPYPLVDNAQNTGQYTSQYAILGTRMYLFGAFLGNKQHKRVYDFAAGTIADMEAAFDSGASTVVFKNGTIGGVPAKGNTICCSGVDWADYFSVGDGVSIAGSGLSENNKTAIIREIEGDELRFDENCFTAASYWHRYLYEKLPTGTYYFSTDGESYRGFVLSEEVPAGVTLELVGNNLQYTTLPPYPQIVQIALYAVVGTPSGTEITLLPPADADHVTISRTVPDMDFVCVNENRLWGCKGDTIYASKLGDPLNWNVYDGLSTDSWTTETGTPGKFTGCCSYQGYPTFFKENAVFKVLGDEPKNLTLRKQNIMGVKKGAGKTVVEIRGKLYYLSHAGVMEWNGGDYPTIISGALGIEPGMVSQMGSPGAGTDTVRYYIQLMPFYYDGNENIPWLTVTGVFVYDTRYGTWHMLSNDTYGIPDAVFAGDGSHNWMIKDYPLEEPNYPVIYELGVFDNDWDKTTNWRVTFADSARAFKKVLTGSESKKGVLRLLIRCRLAGTMKVWIAYDGGDFEEAAEFSEMAKTSKVVPLILRRCDYWQLRLTGTGDAVIYSIAVERYGGEWQQA